MDKLEFVHETLAHAKAKEKTKEWHEKLEKWPSDLHVLVDNMPKAD